MAFSLLYLNFLGLVWIAVADNNSCHSNSDCPDYAECACCWRCNCLFGGNYYRNGRLVCHFSAGEEYVVASTICAIVFFLIFFASTITIYMCLRRRRLPPVTTTLIQRQPIAIGVPSVNQSYQATYSVPLYPGVVNNAPPVQLYQSQGLNPDPPPPYSPQHGK